MDFNWPIIGHQKIVKFLQKSIKNNKISHAYLFYGPKNVGKKTVAKYFALSLICQDQKRPCLKCENCKAFLKDVYPDAFWIRKEKGKKNISIDQIRELKEKISLATFTNSYKIIIIVNAEEMTNEAANSFLKVLEEPPLKTVIILVANSLKGIPLTIISRCQLLKFGLIPKEEIVKYLKEEFNLNEKKAKEIAYLSLNRIGLATKFSKDEEFFKNYLESQNDLIKILEEKEIEKRLKIVEKILKNKDIKTTIFNWQVLIRDFILIQTRNENLIANISFKKDLEKMAKKFSIKKIYWIEKELENLISYLNQNINITLALDNFVINL
jgi:DNA polymerase-3 subunit delta'